MPQRSFEVYVRHRDGRRQFVPLLSRRSDLLRRVMKILEDHGGVKAEVYEAGVHLFDVGDA